MGKDSNMYKILLKKYASFPLQNRLITRQNDKRDEAYTASTCNLLKKNKQITKVVLFHKNSC